MKLYYAPSACSLAAHIALHECAIPFEGVKVNLRKHLTELGQPLETITPKNYIPALELDDGQILTELPAILLYLADLHPQSAIALPASPLERARLHEWLSYIGSEIHKGFSRFFSSGADPDHKAANLQILLGRLGFAAHGLSHQAYLLGSRFSCADPYLYTVLRWAHIVNLDLSPWPVFVDYMARIEARPSTQRALQAEGLRP